MIDNYSRVYSTIDGIHFPMTWKFGQYYAEVFYVAQETYKTYCFPHAKYWQIIGAVVIAISIFWLVRAIISSRRYKKYASQAEAHRKIRDKLMHDFVSKNSAPSNMSIILRASVEEIVHNTTAGSWKAKDVVLAYIHKAVQVHGELNCITEVMFEEALKRASVLDSQVGKKGILFGVPISVKDSFDIEGVPSSIGVLRWANEKRPKNGRIIEYILEAGAVPFCKTNVPQTMMSFECRNPLWGQTENPIKKGYSPGGSSGGEAALLSAGGSVLGIGSDIGGSLRIPAHFSGICALKPSANRFPHGGSRSFHSASLIINPVNGPMARCVSDLIPLTQVCLGKPDLDVVPTPLLSVNKASKKLVIGVLEKLDFISPLPPCTRALQEAKAALVADSHEVVSFKLPFSDYDVASVMYRWISADGGRPYIEALKGEPIDEIYKPFFSLMNKPSWLLWIYKFFTSGYPDKRPYYFLDWMGIKDSAQMTKLAGDRNQLAERFLNAWKDAGIDCLLLPAFATPAIPHNAFPFVSFAAAYTFIWNVLDCVAGVIPVTSVDPVLDIAKVNAADFNTSSSTRLFEAELLNTFSAEKMAGLPVGVQIVTPQYHEAEALSAMLTLENALKKHGREQSSL